MNKKKQYKIIKSKKGYKVYTKTITKFFGITISIGMKYAGIITYYDEYEKYYFKTLSSLETYNLETLEAIVEKLKQLNIRNKK